MCIIGLHNGYIRVLNVYDSCKTHRYLGYPYFPKQCGHSQGFLWVKRPGFNQGCTKYESFAMEVSHELPQSSLFGSFLRVCAGAACVLRGRCNGKLTLDDSRDTLKVQLIVDISPAARAHFCVLGTLQNVFGRTKWCFLKP